MNLQALRRHTPTGDLILEWAKAGRYRIVKYDLPETPTPWHIIRTTWYGSKIGVNGYDMGRPGPYNYQLTTAGNPIALIDALTEVAQQHLKPTKTKNHGRDKLPRTPILAEINIPYTIQALLTNARNDTPIQDLCQLIKHKK